MKINFTGTINDLKGDPVPVIDASGRATGNDLTLGEAATNALMMSYRDDGNDGVAKLERYRLASRIYDGVQNDQDIDLAVEDVAKVKEYIGMAYGPLIVGRCYELLEQDGKDKPTNE